MLTSWSEVSTPALLSIASVLMWPPLAGVLDPAELGQAEVAALADDLRAQVGAVDPDGVVGLVAHVGVRLGAGLDVGADAAVPQQVDRGGQDRPHQLGGRQRRDAGRQAEPVPDLRRDRDRLRGARVDPATGRDQGAVVVGPGGARQVEQPAALGVRRRGVGVRVEEDVPVVEGGDQPDVLGEQHAVAEHVAGHVADADDGEVLGLGVDADLAEVPLDRLPGTARGDAHRLVVVADRAAGGEGVAEPEPVVEGDLVGDVGERRGALVGSDHQVGVVAVVAHHLRRRDDLLDAVHRDQVVGDVEQAADERAVAGDALGQQASRSVRSAGGRLTTKPPLAPTGTMTAFLTICALTRPSTSVRKSSRRSDQRSPPRATGPKRRCTPSTRGQ